MQGAFMAHSVEKVTCTIVMTCQQTVLESELFR